MTRSILQNQFLIEEIVNSILVIIKTGKKNSHFECLMNFLRMNLKYSVHI